MSEQLNQADKKANGNKNNIHKHNTNTLHRTFYLLANTLCASYLGYCRTPLTTKTSTVPTPSLGCGENWDHYANSQVDSHFNQAKTTTKEHHAAVLHIL